MVNLIATESLCDDFSLKDILERNPDVYDEIKKSLKPIELKRFERELDSFRFKTKETQRQSSLNPSDVSNPDAVDRKLLSDKVEDDRSEKVPFAKLVG